MRFRALGSLEVFDGTAWQPVNSAKCRSVLAILLIDARQVVSVDRITDEVWNGDPPASASNLVHGYVRRLRGLLDDRDATVLVTRAPGYVLAVGEDDIDATRFTALIRRGDTAQIAEALELWRGEAFADVPETPLVRDAAARLDEQRLLAIEATLAADLSRGRHAEVIMQVRALTQRYPLRERLWRQLIIALRDSGRRAEALAAYGEIRALLADELGVDPDASLQRLHRDLLASEPPPPRQAPAPPVLIGRDEQLATAIGWMATPTPCVAITGQGGIGKTAFAARLAHETSGLFPDGQFHATLGRGRTMHAALTRLLARLGITDAPRDLPDLAELAGELLGGTRMLIVLEDVPDEAGLRALLPLAAGNGLIVTSRRRLAGLDTLRVMPLDVLPADAGTALLRAAAGSTPIDPRSAAKIVTLCAGLPLAIKLAGARLAARPHFTPADLVRCLTDRHCRLDWLQLGDQGVRAAVLDSYAVLRPVQQQLLRGLCAADQPEFPGWVAAAVLDQPAVQADRVLDDLIEAHLVEPAGRGLTGPRYRIHDLVHLAVRDELCDTDAHTRVTSGWHALAAAADDQLAHWCGLDPEPPPAWRPDPQVLAAAAAHPMRWFDEERATLIHAARQARPAWPLAQRMSTYFELRGHYQDWGEVLQAGLRDADATGDRQGQATMLGLLMHAVAEGEDHRDSLRYAALTIAAYQALGTPPVHQDPAPSRSSPALEKARHDRDAFAVGFEAARLAVRLRACGEHADYLALFDEAMDAFRASQAPLLELWALKHIGLTYLRQRRIDEAMSCLRRAETLVRDLGEESMARHAGGDLAGVAVVHDRDDLAERLAAETLDTARHTGNRWRAGRALVTLGEVYARRGEHRRAAETYREALALWRALNLPSRIRQVETALARLTR
ncbi:AfsR/SARP family transcriptional regulator [Kibdelosporangium aridum]|uniref:AfsR/SARP family transcriptional regulator n=1 Tax=Kibdelosporangium aridum TaxID=2030 RepID=A0A428YA50_KIBAR|nr:BTAD domain-containing putative transcriptional regulator [Kibdelosporangium aridum]RSM64465.1 AfsR/SARP family transcriptional regulator [Kibdelosporangium aridum]